MVTKSEIEEIVKLAGDSWEKQNNILDKKTNFIYDIDDTKTLKKMCRLTLSQEKDRKYAYHRWLNFYSSIYCESLFCKYGAQKVENKKDKNKDIYINGIGYDVKLTQYPTYSLENFNLDTTNGRQDMSLWFYNNQSQEGRNHFKNRIFLVCRSNSINNKIKLKFNFDLIESKIKAFMNNPIFENITINGNNISCAVIEISKEEYYGR